MWTIVCMIFGQFFVYCFFFKQNTPYERRISDWSSDVCSSDLQVVEDDEFVGRFEAVDEVDIRARVGGYLQQVHFTDGAIVAKGDLLFTIDQRPFKTAVAQAEANLKIAESQVEFTSKELERARELSKRGNISVSAVDERENEFLAAQAQVQGAKAALDTAQHDFEYTEI